MKYIHFIVIVLTLCICLRDDILVESSFQWTAQTNSWTGKLLNRKTVDDKSPENKIGNLPISSCKARSNFNKVVDLYGGSNDDDSEQDDSGDADEDEDDSTEMTPGQAGHKSIMQNYIFDMWRKTPPITQVYVGSSILLTVLSLALNKNAWPEFLNLEWLPVLTKFQIWRPFTAFLFFGPLGLNYILTMQFVWTYMAQLEKLNYNKPEEFLVMLIFGGVTLVLTYSALGLSTKFLGHNLSTYLVYIWARLFEGAEVNVMDLFNLKAELLPWFFCAQTFILENEIPFADLLGIVVGHLYHYLTKTKVLKAPQFLRDWFSRPFLLNKYMKFKDDFE